MSTPALTESVSSDGSGSTRTNRPWKSFQFEGCLNDYEHLRIISSSDGMMMGDHAIFGQSEQDGCEIFTLFKPRGYVILCLECSRGVWCYDEDGNMVGKHIFAGHVWSSGCMFGKGEVGCGAAAAVAQERGIELISNVDWDTTEARGAALQLLNSTNTLLRPQEPWW